MSPFLECQARRSLDSCGSQTSPPRPSNGAFALSAAPLSPRYTAGPENAPKLKWRKGVCARGPLSRLRNASRALRAVGRAGAHLNRDGLCGLVSQEASDSGGSWSQAVPVVGAG